MIDSRKPGDLIEGNSPDTVLEWTDGVPVHVMLYLEHGLAPDKTVNSDMAVYSAYWDYLKGRIGLDAQTGLKRLALIGTTGMRMSAKFISWRDYLILPSP